jgi:outer membrane usher protein FimD/PapC
MPGGTWHIRVEQGQITRPTQSTVVEKESKPTKQRISPGFTRETASKGTRVVQTGLIVGTAATRTAFNQYYSITGQNARRNEINAKLTYGAAVASIGLQLARGNLIGAAAATIGTSMVFANQYFNFRKDITDANAMAEYLNRQSNTSINTEGELYKFRLF